MAGDGSHALAGSLADGGERQPVRDSKAIAKHSFRSWRSWREDVGNPEAMFIGVRNFARVGATDLALDALESVVTRGFYCPHAFVHDPWLEPLRAEPRFREILQRAEARSREAEDLYRRAGGERLLGPAH